MNKLAADTHTFFHIVLPIQFIHDFFRLKYTFDDTDIQANNHNIWNEFHENKFTPKDVDDSICGICPQVSLAYVGVTLI